MLCSCIVASAAACLSQLLLLLLLLSTAHADRRSGRQASIVLLTLSTAKMQRGDTAFIISLCVSLCLSAAITLLSLPFLSQQQI